jgi:hypothetical protein
LAIPGYGWENRKVLTKYHFSRLGIKMLIPLLTELCGGEGTEMLYPLRGEKKPRANTM